MLLAAVWWSVAIALSLLTTRPALEPLPSGRFEAGGVMATDIEVGRFGPWAVIGTEIGQVLAELPAESTAARGDRVRLAGVAGGEPGEAAGLPYRGTVRVDELAVLAGPDSPLTVTGNVLRQRVLTRLQPLEGPRALLAGFLVGDTSGLEETDVEAMRRAGLSHFTAVSGSNVALFLGLLYLAAGPLALGPKRRALIGLVGLPIYAAATRFEPSVVRATVMAALVLAGRLFGVVLEAWQLLAGAVILLLTLDHRLAVDLGFQLSVAATAGVLIGARWPMRPGKIRRALAVTLGAQALVAPLLIGIFDRFPLLSAPVNLIAAPLVAGATLLATVGVAGVSPALQMASWLADGVLHLARGVAPWPQIGWLGLMALGVVGVVLARAQRSRPALALVAALVLSIATIGGAKALPESGVIALDVGQGDALLLAGGDGRLALVDGGPDAVVLIERLGAYRVRALDLVVLTHAHADHAAGLVGIVGRLPIGQVWAGPPNHETPSSNQLFSRLTASRVAVTSPEPGDTYQLGSLRLTVLGPIRRYASANDESIVLLVTGVARSMLLTGDIEAIAQADLGPIRADVLKVPHHGGATSDPVWLAGVGADLAVVSVGENDFGHPAPEVLDVLRGAGLVIRRTDEEGDVTVDLGSLRDLAS